MKRLLLASSVVWAAGCAATARTAPPPSVATAEAETRAQQLLELEAENARRAERIRQLEGQLALSRAEVEEMRESRERRAETVRIGAGAPAAAGEGDWVARDGVPVSEADAPAVDPSDVPGDDQARGPRPLLRLYGSPAVPLEDGVLHAGEPRAPALPLPTSAPAPLPLPPATYAPPPIPASEPTYAAVASPAPPPRTERAAADPGAVTLYRAALEHMRSRRLAEAAAAFASFLAAHPSHAYADNARYWRGEVLYAMRRYPEALQEFERVVRDHRGGDKVPDALLKIGLCHQRMGDAARARAYFRRVRNEHPDSVAARLASQEDAS